jgi:hypothetical protein
MAATCPLTTTELSSVTAAAVKSHDNALPAPVVGGPDGISIPNSGIPAANTAFKRLEWMLVTSRGAVGRRLHQQGQATDHGKLTQGRGCLDRPTSTKNPAFPVAAQAASGI